MSTGQRLSVVTPRNLQAQSRLTWVRLKREAFLANAYLVPLRWFIGIGWLRAAVEKLVEPTWYNGDALRGFLGSFERVRTFPTFESFLQVFVQPAAPVMAWLVVGLQIFCGAGILLGRSTNAALLTGIGLNLFFILAGVPNPSAFYILIQLVLFAAGAGAVLGFDGRADAPDRSLMIAAPAHHRAPNPNDRWWLGAAAAALIVISVYALAHATDFSPAGSVNDPALVLGTVAGLGGMTFLLSALRLINQIELDLTVPTDRSRAGSSPVRSR